MKYPFNKIICLPRLTKTLIIMQTLQFTQLFNELLSTLNQAYPAHTIQFTFPAWCQTHTQPNQVYHSHLWANTTLYLQGTLTKIRVPNSSEPGAHIYRQTLAITPTDLDQIQDLDLAQQTLTTPSGLQIILALNP